MSKWCFCTVHMSIWQHSKRSRGSDAVVVIALRFCFTVLGLGKEDATIFPRGVTHTICIPCLVWDVIYTSRTYATMSVSVCLWRLCIVVTGCNGSRISLQAWIDGCLCYLLTTSHLDRWMGWCRDFWWNRGGMEKLIIVAISLILLTESLDRKHVTVLFINDIDIFIIVRVEEFSLVISVEYALYLKNSLC